ncbi:MAG TPA: hypothetical protein VJT31_32955 [Rugosimonospora sp.]|nr:hypothetical protein [Rugosimonospora sp.]
MTEPFPDPGSGYQVPASAYGPPGDPLVDPLVTPPVEGFNGWFGRLTRLVGRNWRRIFAITLLTYGIPTGVLATLLGLTGPRLRTTTNLNGTPTLHLDTGSIGLFVALAVVAIVLGGYLAGVANAATVWSVTRESAGGAAPLGESLRYGLRAGVRLWGWSILYGLVVLAGTCACLLPGLYCALAGCLYAPVALFESGANPISTSFSMVNRNFGASLGRMAALAGIVYGIRLVLGIPAALVVAANRTAGQVLTGVLDVLTAPLAILLTVGSLLLYAELRARVYPTTSAELAAALR